MTVKEVHDKLSADLKDEIEGAVAYHQMALALEEAGCKEYVFFMDIAKDEMTHAHFIKEYCDDNHINIPSEVLQKYDTLKSAHNS